MENEVLKMYEYAEQTIEISLVKEEEIPVMLELMNTIYQELPDKRILYDICQLPDLL